MKSSEPCRLSPCLRSHPGAGAPIVYLEGRSERQWRWLRGLPCVSAWFSASPASEFLSRPSPAQCICAAGSHRDVPYRSVWAMPTILQVSGFSKFKSNPPNKQLRLAKIHPP